MKKNILEIRFKSLNAFEKEVKEGIAKRQKYIQPKNLIFFDSVNSFRGFMTIQKLELLSVIANRNPSSIYELANLVDRKFPAVFKDCKALEWLRFITLKKNKGNRPSKKPELAFPYSVIAVYLPKSPYQIEFSEAA